MARSGYTVASLSRAMNTSPSVVWKWLNGRTQPALPTLRKAARVLGCSIDELGGEVLDG